MIAHSSESLLETATRTNPNRRQPPYTICEYQKSSSKEAGDLKPASYIHISYPLEVSKLQHACKYRRPAFLVSQNYKLEHIVTNTHAVCWVHTSPIMNNTNTTMALAATICTSGHLLA